MIYIIAGVSGVGKTTIAKALANVLNIPYLEADDFHPASNVQKMSQGQALSDKDRAPWLKALNIQLQANEKGKGAILACSALKEKYRRILAQGLQEEPRWIFLKGDFETIHARMKERAHFMPATLLQSQFNDLELPNYGMMVDVEPTQEQILKYIIKKINMSDKAEMGLIGLGVMGKSLSRNIARNNITINLFNRHVSGSEENIAVDFINEFPELKNSQPFDQLPAFVESLALPRKIFLMVNAGKAVDAVIDSLLPHLNKGDIIIDGGNSHYKDTQRRFEALAKQEIEFIGSGVSGGEWGALNGPSIMPGGSEGAYGQSQQVLETIAAKDKDGQACCGFIGQAGAGHFVKMVHNGIEYGEMQLIAEVYGILRKTMQKSPEEIASIFKSWCQTDLQSYLLEITSEILLKKEGETHLIDLILDRAGNKGTGSWTTIAACELGVAIPTMTAALFARYQSAPIDVRHKASAVFESPKTSLDLDIEGELKLAYQQARFINHHQGFDLIVAASNEYQWNINLKELSRIWTQGCIIRSELMENISRSIQTDGSILLNSELNAAFINENALAKVLSKVSQSALSTPCLSASLHYLNAFKEEHSLANVIQAQRDYFGAHTYERTDAPRGQKFHTEWQ